jgi:hypothetical protein
MRGAIAIVVLCAAAACGRSGPIDLVVTPQRSFYRVGERVLITAHSIDERGDPTAPQPAYFWVEGSEEPETSEALERFEVELDQSGWTIVRGCADDDHCDRAGVFVEDGPPILALESPLPGELVTGAIFVRGRVLGPSVYVTVNDGVVAVDGEGVFETTLWPPDGVTHVIVRAYDGISSDRRELDVLKASYRIPVTYDEDDRPVVDLPLAMQVRFGTNVMDRYDSSFPPAAPRFAEIVGRVATTIDVSDLVLAPITDEAEIAAPTLSQQSWSFYRGDVFGAYQLYASSALHTVLSIDGPEGTIVGNVYVSHDRSAQTMLMTSAGEAIVNMNAETDPYFSLWTDLQDGELAAAFGTPERPERESLAARIRVVHRRMTDGATRVVWREMVHGLAHALDQSGELSSGHGVDADMRISELPNSRSSALFGATVRGRSPVARRSEYVPSFTTGDFVSSSEYPYEVYVMSPLVDAIVHLLWLQGAFSHQAADLHVEPMLPPVLHFANGVGGSFLWGPVLDFGQLEIEAMVDGELHRLAATLRVPLEVRFDERSVGYVRSTTMSPVAYVWSAEGSDLGPALAAQISETLRAAWRPIIDELLGVLRFEVAAPPMDTIRAAFPSAGVRPMRLLIDRTASPWLMAEALRHESWWSYAE